MILGHVGSAEAPMRAARRTGLIDQVIEQLRDRIATGAWPVGSRIPTEVELAATTGTSRNTVREAVQSLVHAGLLERRQGSGTYVLASSELAGAVSRRMAAAGRRDVLEVRRVLEVGAARLAAVRRRPEDLARLRELLRLRNEASAAGDADEAARHDARLHAAIVDAAHNEVLGELYAHVAAAVAESVRASLRGHDVLAPGVHVELVEAIADGDADRAAAETEGFLSAMLEELE